MKKLFAITLLMTTLLSSFSCPYNAPSAQEEKPIISTAMTIKSFHDLSIKSIDGSTTINFADFKGKKVLCVNTASECGYTGQYEALETLHKEYKDKLVIIGFPCNQFGGQEPGSPKEIASFCKSNFGVSFLLTEKIEVKGNNQHAVYQWLTQKSLNGVGDYTIKWNFNKFLIDENGKLLEYFESGVKPLDNKIVGYLK